MDALPDELLLMIFSRVADADTLLDGVARTCKRWLRVSRDPAAWAEVRVVLCGEGLSDPLRPLGLSPLSPESWSISELENYCEPAEDDDYSPPSADVRSAARALLHAPALDAIVLDWEHLSEPERVLATSALRRCRAEQVREIRLMGYSLDSLIIDGFGEKESALAAVNHLLWRLRDCLRILDTMVMERCGESGVMRSLAGMRHLEELHLRSVQARYLRAHGYDGQLRGRLPRLRVLAVRSQLDLSIDLDEHGAALAADLLRGAASSLRAVYLRSVALPAEVLDALAACTGLVELHCDAVHVPAIRRMTHLQRLHLELPYRVKAKVTEAQLRECLRAVVRDCGEALAGVRVLQLHADEDPTTHEFPHVLALAASELYAAVARGAGHAEEVSLHLGAFYCGSDAEAEAAVGPLLSPACLPRVRRLYLDAWLPADLDRVAALPESLVELVGSETLCDALDTASKDATARLKQRRPELKVDLCAYPCE